MAGRYDWVYRVYKTTKLYQTNTNKIVKNLIPKLNHKHSKPKHKHEPIFFLDSMRSHQIRQLQYKKSPDLAATVEENNQIRLGMLASSRGVDLVLNRCVAFAFRPQLWRRLYLPTPIVVSPSPSPSNPSRGVAFASAFVFQPRGFFCFSFW